VTAFLRRLLHKSRSTVYSCGDCGERFATMAALTAHREPVCPLVAIKRQLAAWNARQHRDLAYKEAEFDV
jgi:hypothetical protein